MLSRFPDPLEAGRTDVRIRPDADIVPLAVLDVYGLAGADVERLTTGSYNIHFKVNSESGTFDLRRSNRPIDRSNLLFEAEFLAHLQSRHFMLAPELVPTIDGQANYWPGEDGWTLFRWIEPDPEAADMGVTDARIDSAAKTLAGIHAASVNFSPVSRRGDWPIFLRVEEWNERWKDRSLALADHLGPDGDDLRRLATQTAAEIGEIDFSLLPRIGCHADYRMRNLKFAGDDVATVFDFDTAMISTRLLDLGGAASRFSPIAGSPQADIPSGSRFLNSYDYALPLSEYEWSVLPAFIRWRMIRDVTIFYDRWWLQVRDAGRDLFAGAADEMVELARR